MKHLKLIITIVVATFLVALLGYEAGQYREVTRQMEINRHIENGDQMILIWNDDQESIPGEGGLIEVEMIDGNIVYLMNSEAN
jgi:hypothetical protein